MDAPESWLPPNATRVPGVAEFSTLEESSPEVSTAIPGKVVLVDGQVLEDIDRVVIATGFHFTLPFFPPEFHSDDTPREEADERILITDGTMLHNLHKDIFYIPDPTLAFTGIPFYTATFSLFEFQAITIAAVFSGQTGIPSTGEMRAEYLERLSEKGCGKPFHTLIGQDIEYAKGLMEWVNKGRDDATKKTDGYSQEWIQLRDEFMNLYFRTGLKANEPIGKDAIE